MTGSRSESPGTRSTRHLFVVTDIEGVAGVSDWSQTRKLGPELERARGFLSEEINAFVQGLISAAADARIEAPAVSVWDGHGYGGADFDAIDRRVAKFRYDDGRGFAGLLDHALASSPPADALAFVGQHAMEGSGGNLAHTYSSRRVRRHLLNGCEIGEFGTRALHASALGLPTLFISGDDVACEEARALVPGIVRACVKRSIGTTRVESLGRAEACALISSRAGEIIGLDLSASELAPTFRPTPPYEYRIERKLRFGLVPRRDRTLRGDDLVALLRRV